MFRIAEMVDKKPSLYNSLDEYDPFVKSIGACYLMSRLFSTFIPKVHSLYAVTIVGFFLADKYCWFAVIVA